MSLPPSSPHRQLAALGFLQSSLLRFSQVDVVLRFTSEFKLLDRLYIQSQHQIRSYDYLPSLRKVRQLSKRILSLDVSGVCADVAVTKLSPASVLTRQSFESLQWRFLAAIKLLADLAAACGFLIARLTQEMSVRVFLHFPVAFLGLAALSEDFTTSLFGTFRELRTFDKFALVDFPEDERPHFPGLPSDAAFEVEMPEVAAAVPKRPPAKFDIEITGKPMGHLRTKAAGPIQKPKSSLDSLGF
jgi:hypothetical protein